MGDTQYIFAIVSYDFNSETNTFQFFFVEAHI